MRLLLLYVERKVQRTITIGRTERGENQVEEGLWVSLIFCLPQSAGRLPNELRPALLLT